jgi:hypothetical protein
MHRCQPRDGPSRVEKSGSATECGMGLIPLSWFRDARYLAISFSHVIHLSFSRRYLLSLTIVNVGRGFSETLRDSPFIPDWIQSYVFYAV